MPGALALAVVASGAVLPNSLSTSFVQTAVYPILSVFYHDGSGDRSIIQDGVNAPRVLRSWKLSKRLDPTSLAALYTFWQNVAVGPLQPFYFFDPFEVAPGQQIGSNYDPTGASTQGRVTVKFRGNWSIVGGIARISVPNLLMVEVA